MTTHLSEVTDVMSTSPRPRPGPSKLVLLLVSVAFSVVLFLAMDGVHTARLRRAHPPTTPHELCRVRDPVRYHALKPNCSLTDYWGSNSYRFFTNSLGFRDEKIRDVPLTDPRPRILVLGDSFAEGKLAWSKSFVGRIADRFPQYDILNGGLAGYSPSNYLTTAQMVLAKGFDVDEVIVFLDNSAVQHEAAMYHDVNAEGAVVGLGYDQQHPATSRYVKFRRWLTSHFALTAHVFRLLDRFQAPLIRHGYYHLPAIEFGDPFDMEMSAWTYRKVNETELFPAGYAPLGVERGIAKELVKMNLLWKDLENRNIPISIVIYPHLAQLVHDTPENRQVQIFRQWCEGKCKRFISVIPAFFAAKEHCPRTEPGCWYMKLFVFGDIHFTPAGNALVADAVIKALEETPPAKREGQAQPKPAQRAGAR
jgi:hypothetical protein